MNQRVIIYIILSAILLYLYYRNRDITVFAAFVVVVGGTLIFRGATTVSEGLTGDGSGKVDKECSKLGFKPPKIQKKNMKGNLITALKNIQTVADKHWPFNDLMGGKPKNDNAKDIFKNATDNEYIKKEQKKLSNDKETSDLAMKFLGGSVQMYDALLLEPSQEKEDKLWKEINSETINKIIKGGEMYSTLLKKNHDNLKKDDADKDVIALSQYFICLSKQWLIIWKQVKLAKGGSDDSDGGDDEETGKKKTRKKKSKKNDDDEEEDE